MCVIQRHGQESNFCPSRTNQDAKGHHTHTKHRDTIRRLIFAPVDDMEGNTHGREQYHTRPSRNNKAGQERRRRTTNQGTLGKILHQDRSASPHQRGIQLLYLKHNRETRLIPWRSAAWDTPDTSSLSGKWKRDETNRLNNDKRGSDFNTHEVYELSCHCKHTIQGFRSPSTLVTDINPLDYDTLLIIWRYRFNFRRLSKIANSDYYTLHVCLSVRPHGTTGLPLKGFSWNLLIEYSLK